MQWMGSQLRNEVAIRKIYNSISNNTVLRKYMPFWRRVVKCRTADRGSLQIVDPYIQGCYFRYVLYYTR